jgi:hypothetical protein
MKSSMDQQAKSRDEQRYFQERQLLQQHAYQAYTISVHQASEIKASLQRRIDTKQERIDKKMSLAAQLPVEERLKVMEDIYKAETEVDALEVELQMEIKKVIPFPVFAQATVPASTPSSMFDTPTSGNSSTHKDESRRFVEEAEEDEEEEEEEEPARAVEKKKNSQPKSATKSWQEQKRPLRRPRPDMICRKQV